MVFKQLTKEESKIKIKELVDEYANKIKEKEHLLDERNTERFIERIFHSLNWDIDNFDQVIRRDSVKIEDKTKIPDYVLYINGEKKVVIEAKAFGESLDNPKYVKQALEYGYYKQVRVCILTNGKQIRVYDPFILSKSSEGKLLFSININQYESFFEQRLWFLSYNEIKENTILAKFATKGAVKKPVDEEVIDNIIKGRKLLIDSIMRSNEIEDFKLAREHAHKIINRFLFIRVAEDRGFFKEFDHGRILEDRLNIFKKRLTQKIKSLMNEIKELFMEINYVYNGELFKPHPCEELKIDSESLKKVIYLMYYIKHENSEEDQVDFSKLDADVLGSIYEKFLGTIMHETKSGKLVEKIDNGVRKEMGQYYTPQYVVDFIVRNTVDLYLKENPDKLFSIKLIDPACGSGAFLIKAFDSIYNKYRDFNKQQESKRKTNDLSGFINDKSVARINEVILHKHIHGVDLDSEAVELAKINLWLRTIQEEMKLNELNKNIKQGNSLISDKIIDPKNAFDWDKEFPYKFDIVIGNPPYGVELTEELQKYFDNKYDVGSTDTAVLFIQRAYSLLKPKGMMGFIVPKAFCFASNWKKIRDLLWKDIEIIIDCGKAWKEVKLEQIVFVVKKDSNSESYESSKFVGNKLGEFNTINKQDSASFGFLLNGISKKELSLAQKIKENSVMLNSISTNQRGAILQKSISEKGDLEVIGGAQVQRFGVTGIKGRINKSKIDSDLAYIKDNSVLVQNIVAHIENPTEHIQITCAIPANKNQILVDTINQIILNKNISQECIWGILNSKIVNWYAYRFIFGKAIRTMHFDNSVTNRIPIPKKVLENQDKINSIVLELMKLQKPYLSVSSKSANSDSSKKGYYDLVEEKTKIKMEIDKLELMLNELVYELYGLSKEDIKIIEENLN